MDSKDQTPVGRSNGDQEFGERNRQAMAVPNGSVFHGALAKCFQRLNDFVRHAIGVRSTAASFAAEDHG